MSDRRQRLSPARQALLQQRLRRGLTAGSGRASIPPRPDPTLYPLSFAQERLWFLSRLTPGDPVYNRPTAFRLTGPLDRNALEKAISEIVRRHEPLRAVFDEEEGRPRQVIQPPEPVNLPLADLSTLPPDEREQTALDHLARAARQPVNLGGPLFRGELLRLDETHHILFLLTHHIAFDAWSARVLANELISLYQAFSQSRPSPLPNLPIQYADYAHHQRTAWAENRWQAHLEAWRRQLADLPPALNLPIDHPRPALPSHRGASHTLVLPPPLVDSLQALGRARGTTLFMTLLAAFNVLLHRYTGQEDIIVGAPVAGRDFVETEPLIGVFINTLPLRARMNGNPTFGDLLAQVQQVTLDAYSRRELPFEKLVDALNPERQLDQSPLFQVLFNMENIPAGPVTAGPLTMEPLAFDRELSQFELSVEMVKQPDGLHCRFTYQTDLFEAGTIRRMAGHFHTLLDSAVAAPDTPIGNLEMLAKAERHQILVEWNDTRTNYPHQCIHELCAAQAQRTPDAVAVVYGEHTLTYDELNRQANRLAHYLRRLQVGADTPVGVCLPRSAEMVVVFLAILKAGGAYLPLDPDYPAERLTFMLADAGASVVVTRTEWHSLLSGSSATLLRLDTLAETLAQEPDTNPPVVTTPQNLAYIMYTSGSTGRPKGIAVPHRAVVRLVCRTDYIHLTPADVVAQASVSAFDAATFEIWGALLNGARLVGVEKDTLLAPVRLACQLENDGITTMFVTTALFNQVAGVQPDAFSRLKNLLFGGETVNPEAVRQVLAHHPPARLLHMYGPTETTTFATWHLVDHVPPDTTTVPIGRPIANTTVYLLDAQGWPVPVGVPGEIFIGGDGVARGYVNRPDLTAARFVPNPFDPAPGARLYKTGDLARYRPDGSIEFLGRIDRQVKLRGFRIEPAEIETVLEQHPAVQQTVVEVWEPSPGNRRLAAYLVSGSDAPSPDTLRQYLRERLPDYMLPDAFMLLNALPLTPNAKVDRSRLPRPTPADTRRPAVLAPPRDELEQQLVQIWESVLGIRPIGIHDSFFDLGGHSLLAVQLFARIARLTGKELPLSALFHSPTIAHLADLLRQESWSPQWRQMVAVQAGGSRPPLFLVPPAASTPFRFAALSRFLGPDQPVYGFEPVGLDGKTQPLERVEDMAEIFVEELVSLQPEGPYFLGGICFGALVALEMGQQLLARGQKVGLLAVLDAAPPLHGPGWTIPRKTPVYYLHKLRRYGLPWLKKTMRTYTKQRYLAWRRRWSQTPQIRRTQPILDAAEIARQRYVAKTFSGPILLIQSEEAVQTWSNRDGWYALAGGEWMEDFVPHTTHASLLLTEEGLRQLAERLNSYLAMPRPLQTADRSNNGAVSAPPDRSARLR